jgi:hypothetical protein
MLRIYYLQFLDVVGLIDFPWQVPVQPKSEKKHMTGRKGFKPLLFIISHEFVPWKTESIESRWRLIFNQTNVPRVYNNIGGNG